MFALTEKDLNKDHKTVMLPGLNREGLIEELLVEILLNVMDKNDGFALVIKLRSTCSPHHLQNIYSTHTRTHIYKHTRRTFKKYSTKHSLCVPSKIYLHQSL